ncbi:MAG: hypothetical protein K0S74_438 [Chlamydiales bacterium]|jgi:formylglycine-generating enzyme required for sulfatase activity|nr:hypothetical protein [Chlamydiales bacterium]
MLYRSSLTIENILQDYTLIEPIGYGPSSTTYRAVDKHNGKILAIRIVPTDDTTPVEWLEQAEFQTALLKQVISPYIERIFFSGYAENYWYCVKDYIHDGTGKSCNLRDYVRRCSGKISQVQIYYIALQIIEALETASFYSSQYHQGIFHGQLKPENIMVAYYKNDLEFLNRFSNTSYAQQIPFEIILTDFQPYPLKDKEAIFRNYHNLQSQLNQIQDLRRSQIQKEFAISLYRSYDYQAPEVASDFNPSLQADIFSLGVILYELLTHTLPNGTCPSPSKVNLKIHVKWDQIVARCLQYFPQDRYFSYQELREDLQKYFADIFNTEDNSSLNILNRNDTLPSSIQSPYLKKSKDKLTPKGMVYIPAGTFFVGGKGCGADALPIYECATKGFYLDRTPVTYAQFNQFVQETGYVTEAETGLGAPLWIEGEWKILPTINWRKPLGGQLPRNYQHHPVTQVSYADAIAYARWLERRLPTEQEWEYAARAGQEGIRYPWGNTLTKAQANFSSDCTTPVMSYPPNAFGLYDIVGNVWEWTNSWYLPYPGNTTPNSHYGEQFRIVRGGAWMYNASYCLIPFRNANQADRCYPTLGFRTALSLD